MKKFEIKGIEYKFNEETGRYSKTENGKTVRIGKAEYEEAASRPVDIKTIPCENGDHLVEFAKIGTDYGVRFVGEDEFHEIKTEEITSEVRKGGIKFYAQFEFMGRKYWICDAIVKSSAKKRSARAKKNAAYEYKWSETLSVTLTEKQVDFLRHMTDTCFWEHGLDSCLWIDVLCDEIGGQFADRPMTVGAMVSTLREKDLIAVSEDRINGRKCRCFSLTPSGKDVARDLGIE